VGTVKEDVMAVNLLTGKLSKYVPELEAHELWLLLSLHRHYRDRLKDAMERHMLGIALLSDGDFIEVLDELRHAHRMTGMLELALDYACRPVIDKVMQEPAKRSRPKLEVYNGLKALPAL
jgi:hypothetical protein